MTSPSVPDLARHNGYRSALQRQIDDLQYLVA
jgi:hypothetical protein